MLWVIQTPPGAFDARVKNCNPSVVPGVQLTVTDEHAGTTAKVTSSGGGGGAVVVVVVVVVVVGAGVSSSVVVTSRVRSATLS